METKAIRLKKVLRMALWALLIGAAGTLKAQNFTVGDLNYSVNEGTQTVTLTGHVDGTNATGELIIPDSVLYQGNYYAVTTIGNNAFFQCHGFSGSLSVPNSVTTIGEQAFYQCDFTGSLTIGNSVTTIGRSAFEGCTGFTGSLTIPNSVTTIGDDAFYACYGFTGSLTIPNSVTTIGNRAFKYCTGFTGSLTIPNSVTTIGEDAFYVCTGFTGSLTIPNSVTTIGDRAFYDCTGFTGSLTIPNSVTTIGDNAFYQCYGFTGSLTIPNSVTTIGYNAFYQCYGFTGSLTIGNSVTTIGSSAFRGCSGFTGSLTIPNSVTTIGDNAFYQCYGFMGSLTISNSVTTIGSSAFRGCSGFTGSLTIPNSVTTIVDNAFYQCTGFTGSLTIGDAVTTIGNSAFGYCIGFTSIESSAFASPALGVNVFNNWNLSIPVYVPCGSGPDYSGWGGFSNIIDPCTFYVKDVMLLGGSESEVNALLPDRLAEGWHLINNDLNAGCGSGSDYIYLLYKSEASDGVNHGYVTGFYISNEGGTAPDTLTYDGRLYHLVPYDGGNHFISKKGDLNSHAGGADIHLYYTKFVFSDNRTVTEITFNATQSGAVGVNGGTTGYDLNSGAGGSYIYMHVTTEEAPFLPDYVDLGLPSGLLWANCNVGAYAPEECGLHFAWAETQPKNYYSWNNYQYCNGNYTTLTKYCYNPDYGYNGYTDTLHILQPEDDAVTVRWGEDWRTPTKEEWQELCQNTTFTWTTQNGVNGGLFTADNGNSLFLPAAGYYEYGYCVNKGSECFYWSSSLIQSGNPLGAEYFHSSSGEIQIAYKGRSTGCTVRPVRIPEYLVTATADPAEGGMVSGGGNFTHGQNCILTATANTGYTFVNWTKDGVEVSTNASYTFSVTASGAYVAHFTETSSTITQSTHFVNGWTWWSTYIEEDEGSCLTQLESGLGASGQVIKSQSASHTHVGNGWYGGFTSLDNALTYRVKTNAEVDMDITGQAANTASHPVTLQPNWTWIGYPCTTTMSVTTALAGITPTVGDILKSQTSSTVYLGTAWAGALNTITPGMGLMYYSKKTTDMTLVYPTGAKGEETKPNLTPENNRWQPNTAAYPDNMTVIAVVELDDDESALRQAQGPQAQELGDNYELAVFANDECRGSVQLLYIEPLNRYMAILTVAGDTETELCFGLYDMTTGEEYHNANETLTYQTNAIVGSPDAPFVVHFRSNTGFDELSSRIQVFPNPVERGQRVTLGLSGEETIEMRIDIVNALGVVVETRRATSLQAPNVPGIYTLRITVEGQGTCYRKLVVK